MIRSQWPSPSRSARVAAQENQRCHGSISSQGMNDCAVSPLAARRGGLLEIDDRRATPEIDEHIGQAILVEVTQQTARGGHRRVVGEGPGLQDKGLIAILGCSGRRSEDHLVDARIDVAEVVRQPISIDVAQRGRGAECREVGRQVREGRVDLANGLVGEAGRLGEGELLEAEACGDGLGFGAGQRGELAEEVEGADQSQRHQECDRSAKSRGTRVHVDHLRSRRRLLGQHRSRDRCAACCWFRATQAGQQIHPQPTGHADDHQGHEQSEDDVVHEEQAVHQGDRRTEGDLCHTAAPASWLDR